MSAKQTQVITTLEARLQELSTVLANLQSSINEKAASTHTHSYDDLDDLPTIPTNLPANGGNVDTVDDKHASDFATASITKTLLYLVKIYQYNRKFNGQSS